MPIFTRQSEPKETTGLLAQQNDHDYLFKLVIVGESGVGKSSILQRFCDDTFCESTISTLGVDFKFKYIERNGKKIKLTLWDTSGQERFRTITQSFYRGAAGVMLVYDCASASSFEECRYWVSQIQRYCGEKVPILLIGNKSDSPVKVVEHVEAERLAAELGAQHFATSAKLGTGVQEAFAAMTSQCVAQAGLQCAGERWDVVKLGEKSAKTGWCC